MNSATKLPIGRNCNRRQRSNQRGASDLDTIWMILIVITLLTIAYLILGWVKSSKDAKVERALDTAIEAAKQRRAPKNRDTRAPNGHQMVF